MRLPGEIGFDATNAFALDEGDRGDRGGRLLAFGQLVAKPSGRAHLARLIVHPSSRAQGHGEALVRGLLEGARALSFERVSLNVDASNTAALGLYRKCGFEDAPRPPGEIAISGTRYMERPGSSLMIG